MEHAFELLDRRKTKKTKLGRAVTVKDGDKARSIRPEGKRRAATLCPKINDVLGLS
jgi:hypothetical protein